MIPLGIHVVHCPFPYDSCYDLPFFTFMWLFFTVCFNHFNIYISIPWYTKINKKANCYCILQPSVLSNFLFWFLEVFQCISTTERASPVSVDSVLYIQVVQVLVQKTGKYRNPGQIHSKASILIALHHSFMCYVSVNYGVHDHTVHRNFQ